MSSNVLLNGKLDNSNLSEIGYKHRKGIYIVIFGMLFLPSGFGIPFNLGGTAVLIGCLVLAFGLVLFYGKISIKVNVFILALLFILSVLITTIYHNDEIKQFLIYAIYLVIALCLSQTLKYDFNVIYVKLLYFLSFFSLVMWGLYIVFPTIIRLLPTISNQYGLQAYTAFFSTITSFGNMALTRNQGFFWEPGAYQTFVNVAVAIVMFSKSFAKKRLKYTIVFAATIITTFSTTGYIVLCGLILSYSLNEIFSSKSLNRLLKYISILLGLVIVVFVVYSMLPSDAQFQLFGKIFYYLNNTDKLSSTSVRVNAFETAIQSFIEYPLLGSGITKLIPISGDAEGIMTSTPINYFAFYGLFVGIVANLGLYMYAKSITRKKLLSLAVFLCLSLSTISENYMRDPIILTLIFLGLSSLKSESFDEYSK